MRRLIAIVLVGSVFVLLGAGYGLAQKPAPTARIVIKTDQEQGVFRFVIDGQEVARLGVDGLHVEGDVTYSGVLTDVGDLTYAP